MAFKSFYLKLGKLRLVSRATLGGPYFLEVPFRGPVTAPVDRPRPAENLMTDRGRATDDAHYVQGPDDVIFAPLPFSCRFKLANTEPNFSKFLTLIRGAALTVGAGKQLSPNKVWASTKGSTQVRGADPEGTGLFTTPGFADPEKWCCNVELLWFDPDAANDRGFRWAEVFFPPDRQVTEGEQDVQCDLSGEVYGAISTITAFTAATET